MNPLQRLLVLTPGFAASEADEDCIPPLQAYVRAMQAYGVDIQVVALEYPFRDGMERWQGAPVYSANGQNRRWLRPRTWWRTWRTAQALLREWQPQAVHSFWLGPAWVLGEWLTRRTAVPHLCTLMGQDACASNFYLRLVRPGHALRWAVLSDFQQAVLKKNTGLQAAHTVPWGIAAAELPTQMPPQRSMDVLGVGSLIPVKNWEKWLLAVSLLHQKYPHLRAMLIGDGPLRPQLERTAAQLGLSACLTFAGQLTRSAVLAHMRQARVLLHSADYESYGYVLAEAAAQGCWRVSTPVGIAPLLARCAAQADDLAALTAALLPAAPAAADLPFRMEDTAAAYLRIFEELRTANR